MSPTVAAPVVRLEHLCKVYPATRHRPAVTAVDDVSLSIAPGETLGLVGGSGSGKTTLGRLVLRLIEPTAGRILFTLRDGIALELAALSGRELRAFRRHAQIVFQDPYTSLDPRMTVRAIVAEPLRIHRMTDTRDDLQTRVRELIEMVGLDKRHLEDRPGALSGGQRQRVGIARAIATNPQLIVADEPVTALDVSIQAQVLNLLHDLQDQLGFSYLFISHDLAVVEQMADRIAVMTAGRVVELGDRTSVLTRPQHPHTQRLVQLARSRSVLPD